MHVVLMTQLIINKHRSLHIKSLKSCINHCMKNVASVFMSISQPVRLPKSLVSRRRFHNFSYIVRFEIEVRVHAYLA